MGSIQRIFISLLIFSLVIAGCTSDEDKKREHFARGNDFFEKGDFKSARIEFKNAIQIDPGYIEAHMQLGETSLKLGDAQSAFRAYAAVAELAPDNVKAQLKLATFFLLAKKYADSRKKIDLVLTQEPRNTDALLIRATLSANENEP
jgi:Tfp pilus assembly protein PilF